MRPLRAATAVFTVFVVGVLSGTVAGVSASDVDADPYDEFDPVVRTLTTIESSYIEPRSAHHLAEAAIRGMIEDLDPHSRWMSAEETEALRLETGGEYEGIGVEIRSAPDGPVILSVLPRSPAERDGILPGDVLLAVDDTEVVGLDMDRLAGLLQGPRGAGVTLTVRREGQPSALVIATVRDRVYTPAVQKALFPDDIGYFRLKQFQERAAKELEEEIELVNAASPLKGIILDLRDNPGGLLTEAVGVSDLFLDAGTIVSTRDRREEVAEAHHATGDMVVGENIPMIVLVNAGSASASEIVAAALQQTGRAQLVGGRSYGKGSVQSLFEYRDHSALKLTTGRYYTPSGDPIKDLQGIVPDHTVVWPGEPGPADDLATAIQQLEVDEATRANLNSMLTALRQDLPAPPETAIPWGIAPEDRLDVDPQLQAALTLITANP